MPRRVEPRHPVWLVEWLDASDAFPSWSTLAGMKRSDRRQLVQSVGYLVAEDDEFLTLATSCVDTEDAEHYGGGIHIPVSLVRSKKRLA